MPELGSEETTVLNKQLLVFGFTVFACGGKEGIETDVKINWLCGIKKDVVRRIFRAA